MELCDQLCRSLSSSEESFASSSEEEGAPDQKLLDLLCETIQTPLSLGVLAAAASLAVYLPQEKQALCLSGSSDVVFHVEENAAATSFAKDGLWVVAFRGTELSQWKDVADDVNIWRKPLYWASPSYVHEGFLRHYLKLQASVLKEFLLQTQQHGIDRVLITGHSLGGTSAYLTASFLSCLCQSLMFSGRLFCKTFGCPRIGDVGFFRWCSTELRGVVDSVCYVNSSDIVVRVPLQLSENWVHRSIVFRRKEPPFKAHSMENYFKATLQQELLETA